MSVFTNSARGAAEQAGDYVAAIIGLVGERDPMTILRATPGELARAIAGLSAAQVRQREKPAKW